MSLFDIAEKEDGVRILFSAELANVDRVAAEMEDFLNSKHIEAHSFIVILCLREALVNAVIHGNRQDMNKRVRLDLRIKEDNLIIKVEDEGDGFDWRKKFYDEPTIKAESGRGMMIMKKLFKNVKYNRKGNKLIMEKPL